MSKYVLSERGNNALRAYTTMLAGAMGVSVVGFSVQQYVASPSVQQSIESKIQEDSTFLSMINNTGVPDQEGEKLGIEKTARNLLKLGVLSDEQIAEATGLALDEVAKLRLEGKR